MVEFTFNNEGDEEPPPDEEEFQEQSIGYLEDYISDHLNIDRIDTIKNHSYCDLNILSNKESSNEENESFYDWDPNSYMLEEEEEEESEKDHQIPDFYQSVIMYSAFGDSPLPEEASIFTMDGDDSDLADIKRYFQTLNWNNHLTEMQNQFRILKDQLKIN